MADEKKIGLKEIMEALRLTDGKPTPKKLVALGYSEEDANEIVKATPGQLTNIYDVLDGIGKTKKKTKKAAKQKKAEVPFTSRKPSPR